MSLLLDTHAVLWYALDDARLGTGALSAIDNEPDQVYVSPASFWELAIKISRGRYTLAKPFKEFWQRAITRERFTLLPIAIRHADRIISLPQLHRDPFDRMLTAQAVADDLTIVSNESLFDGYDVRRIW